MFHTCHWFRLRGARTLARTKWPQVHLKSVLYVFLALWYQITTDMKNACSSSQNCLTVDPLLMAHVQDLCLSGSCFVSLLSHYSFSLWFIHQLSTKYVLAGQICLRIIPCVEELAIKCFIYLPQEECVSDRGKKGACLRHVCCSFQQGPSWVLWGSRGSSRQTGR